MRVLATHMQWSRYGWSRFGEDFLKEIDRSKRSVQQLPFCLSTGSWLQHGGIICQEKTRIISVYRSIKHPVRFIRSHHSTTGGALTLCLPKHCDWKKTFSFFQNHLLQRRSTTGSCLLYAWLPWRKISSYHKSLVMFLIQLFKVATKGHCLRKTPSKHSTRLDFYWEARYSARSPWF